MSNPLGERAIFGGPGCIGVVVTSQKCEREKHGWRFSQFDCSFADYLIVRYPVVDSVPLVETKPQCLLLCMNSALDAQYSAVLGSRLDSLACCHSL